jgi:hypothetical protein
VAEAQEFEREIEAAEDSLKQLKEKHRTIVEDTLPKMMRSTKVHEFKTENGLKVVLKPTITCSVLVANREPAWDWLEQNKHGGILKREVSVAFGVTDATLAQECAKYLAEKYNRTVDSRRWAEPQTLKALIKSLIEEQKSVPRDLFGIREFDVADIKAVKTKK